MQLEVLEPGILTTIQDRGRFGFQASGFSVSGCMDVEALYDANILVNNPIDEAVLEMMFMGGTFQFTGSTYIALTGADMQPILNGVPIDTYKAIKINSGDVLQCQITRKGRFGYLAIAGGFKVPLVLGSKSTNLKCGIGGFIGRKLAKGDKIPIKQETKFLWNAYLKEMPAPKYSTEIILRVVPGPQYDYFTSGGIQTFCNKSYVVTEESDRMGYRLEGPKIEYHDHVDIISDAIVFGSIQIPAKGTPMILLADRQTTGGYAKIGTVITPDLSTLVQCMPGTSIHFSMVTVEEAIKIHRRDTKKRKQKQRATGYSKSNEALVKRIFLVLNRFL